MSSHLNTYVGPFVETGQDSDGGPRREEFDKLHSERLSSQRTGYRSTDVLCWLPNGANGAGVTIDRYSDGNVWQLTPKIIAAQLEWFHETYAAEIATLTRLWPDAEVQFGVVAYYL